MAGMLDLKGMEGIGTGQEISADENYLGRVFSIIFTASVLFMTLGSIIFSSFVYVCSINSYYVIGVTSYI